jgi:hypothetical protein
MKKRIRVNVEISEEDYKCLQELMSKGDYSARDIVMKGIRLLVILDKGDCELITPAGGRIPNSVIFS